MSGYQAEGGSWEPRRAKITTTDVTTIVATGEARALANLRIANLTGSTPSVTVAVFDGTSRYYLRYQEAIAANGTIEITDKALNKSDSVEVSISANSVDVYATIITAT